MQILIYYAKQCQWCTFAGLCMLLRAKDQAEQRELVSCREPAGFGWCGERLGYSQEDFHPYSRQILRLPGAVNPHTKRIHLYPHLLTCLKQRVPDIWGFDQLVLSFNVDHWLERICFLLHERGEGNNKAKNWSLASVHSRQRLNWVQWHTRSTYGCSLSLHLTYNET